MTSDFDCQVDRLVIASHIETAVRAAGYCCVCVRRSSRPNRIMRASLAQFPKWEQGSHFGMDAAPLPAGPRCMPGRDQRRPVLRIPGARQPTERFPTLACESLRAQRRQEERLPRSPLAASMEVA